MLVLHAQGLQKSYRYQGKPVAAVKQVSLAIAAGDVLAFLGPNGAGKTTTIKMIAGLVLPDTGTVEILGRDPYRHPSALRSIGAVLEGNRNLYWRLSAEENLDYFGVLRGLSPKVAHQRGLALLERFDLMAKRRTVVQALSRGMQQKLAIAVALIHDPPLLLLDEPTLGLDVEATQHVKGLIREIAQEGRAILLTTHQLDIAEELSDRVAIINQGEIIVEEPTEQLIRQFSGTTYEIELEKSLDSDRHSKIDQLGGTVEGNTIYLHDPSLLYHLLDILKPLPLLRIQKDDANLTEIFLKLVGRGKTIKAEE